MEVVFVQTQLNPRSGGFSNDRVSYPCCLFVCDVYFVFARFGNDFGRMNLTGSEELFCK